MSLLSLLCCFRKERLPHVRYLPLAALLAMAGLTPHHLLPLSLGISWLLVASYRLRDDLADREADLMLHPGRVLCRVKDPVRIRELYVAAWLGMSLGAFALGCMGASVARALGGAVLLIVVELGYRHSSHERRGWVLLKYPVFVLLQQPAVSVVGAFAALLVYVGIGLFEVGDDARLGVHSVRSRGWLRRAAFVVLTMTTVLSVLQRFVGGGQPRHWITTMGGNG